jgi:hypothetical protein
MKKTNAPPKRQHITPEVAAPYSDDELAREFVQEYDDLCYSFEDYEGPGEWEVKVGKGPDGEWRRGKLAKSIVAQAVQNFLRKTADTVLFVHSVQPFPDPPDYNVYLVVERLLSDRTRKAVQSAARFKVLTDANGSVKPLSLKQTTKRRAK